MKMLCPSLSSLTPVGGEGGEGSDPWVMYPLTSVYRKAVFPKWNPYLIKHEKNIPNQVYIPKMNLTAATNHLSKSTGAKTKAAKAKTPKAKVAKNPAGRKAGLSNFSKDELFFLLETLEEILPIGPEEGEKAQHAMQGGGYPGREVNPHRRKYHTLHRKLIPTGDPNIPPEVLQAKRIKHLIGQEACTTDGEEAYDCINNSFEAGGGDLISDSDGDSDVEDFVMVDTDADTTKAKKKKKTNKESAKVSAAPAVAPTVAPSKQSGSNKRGYTNRAAAFAQRDETSQASLGVFQMSLVAQQEDREAMMQAITPCFAGAALYFGNAAKPGRNIDGDDPN